LFSCNLEGGFFAAHTENISFKCYKADITCAISPFQFSGLFLDFDCFLWRLTFILCFFLISVLMGRFGLSLVNNHHH
jgi:hypothetical protein